MRHLLPLIVLALCFSSNARAANREIPLPGVQGRLSHFAIDTEGKRLFLAAPGNNTIEVIDLAAGKVSQQIKGIKAPQGIAYAPDLNRLAVASDEDGSLHILDGKSLKELAKLDFKDTTGAVRYDPATHHFWGGYGSGALAEVDALTGKQLANVKLDAQPEAFELESKGKRIFVNVPNAGHIAIVDREQHAVIAKWELRNAAANVPLALDETNHRLFVGCRQPAKLLIMDSETGATFARMAIPADTDDVFYDAAGKRVYVVGEGALTLIAQDDADHYSHIARQNTALGARTAFFSPETRQFYIAAPAKDGKAASILIFDWGRP